MNQYKLCLKERSDSYTIGDDIDLNFIAYDEIGDEVLPTDWELTGNLFSVSDEHELDASCFEVDSTGIVLSIASSITDNLVSGYYRLEIKAVINSKEKRVYKGMFEFFDAKVE